ncbi:MAG: hypothetical protein MI892_19250 [Desulfobacterales bacterium]|nr:hypothetical protein [Desulfobacterales bacterium]
MIKIDIDILRAEYIFYENDVYFGKLKMSRLKTEAILYLNSAEYLFKREKNWEGIFFCPLKDGYDLYAEKPVKPAYDYWISYQGQKYLLKPGELFRKKTQLHFELYNGRNILGSIKNFPKQDFLCMDFRIKLPKVCKCFIFWLACYSWKNKKGFVRAKSMLGGDIIN